MKIYITDLEAYNNGFLIGEWAELPMSKDELAELNENILQEGKRACKSEDYHEESFITDYECDYMKISEYSDIYELNEIAEKYENLDKEEKEKLKFLISEGYEFDYAIENINDCEIYMNTNLKELAEQFVDDGMFGDIPDSISSYIDYEAIARDLSFDYTERGNHVFRAN